MCKLQRFFASFNRDIQKADIDRFVLIFGYPSSVVVRLDKTMLSNAVSDFSEVLYRVEKNYDKLVMEIKDLFEKDKPLSGALSLFSSREFLYRVPNVYSIFDFLILISHSVFDFKTIDDSLIDRDLIVKAEDIFVALAFYSELVFCNKNAKSAKEKCARFSKFNHDGFFLSDIFISVGKAS